MKKTGKLGSLVSSVMSFADEHQRELQLAGTITGIVLTGIAAAKAGMKASAIMEKKREEMEKLRADYEEYALIDTETYERKRSDLTVDTVKEMAPVVLPPVIIGGATIASAICGYSSASKQIAALSAAYNISEKSLKEYQEKAKEVLGKKDEVVKDAITKDKVDSNPPRGKEIIHTCNGNYLCYDSYSGRYFRSNSEAINRAVNEINRRLMDEYFISLNEFYYELGLDDVKLGAELGFTVDYGLIDIRYTYTGEKETGEPVCVLNYNVSTKYRERLY